ncbi:hypothetical protein [Piscinibacter sp. XHJ-5]|uniref:hypothetical protein n=1 Tax=Piscinibacter sp. XHJ-5 TaxID=3037797 RepID=UPI00245325E7|nr:hypothetical protein [Piscinibacter sp. XHJ-5]
MRLPTRTLPVLAFAALAAGCSVEGTTRLTGGGTLPSAGGAQSAVVTVNADTCASSPKGRVTYADRSSVEFEKVGGVSFRADVVKAGMCAGAPPNGLFSFECNCPLSPAVVADYTSTNPAAPGSGKLYACFTAIKDDTKQGSDKHVVRVDELRLVGGPFDNYINKGIMDGNVQTQACKS